MLYLADSILEVYCLFFFLLMDESYKQTSVFL